MHGRVPVFLWLVVVGFVGCSRFAPPPTPSRPLLPPAQPPPQSVALEIAFVRADTGASDLAEVWQAADETVVPVPHRQLLKANGLRMGRIGPTVPPAMERLLPTARAEAGAGEVGSQGTLRGPWSHPTVRFLQLRPNETGRLVTRPADPEPLLVLYRDGDGVHGRTLPQAECLFRLSVTPRADGHVRLQVLPVIEYGNRMPRIAARQGAWVIEPHRETWKLEDLATSVDLAPGQILMVGCDIPPRGIGQAFLAPAPSPHGAARLVLIRNQQSPGDRLFAEPERF